MQGPEIFLLFIIVILSIGLVYYKMQAEIWEFKFKALLDALKEVIHE